jgi:hypothetical protein
MSDVSKERKLWAGVRDAAQTRLTGLSGKLVASDVQYEIMRWVHADLVLIFYPHKTSAGNYHVRVRAGRCTDRKLLRKCVMALAENTCNFQFPTERAFHDEGVRQAVTENRPLTH